MAKPEGFICDSCGIYDAEPQYKTVKTTKYDGPFIDGSVRHELCPDCAPKPDDLPGYAPTRHRTKAAQDPVEIAEVHVQ